MLTILLTTEDDLLPGESERVKKGTVYIETVSPLSTLNRYHFHLGSML
jgi:hypothetical protein